MSRLGAAMLATAAILSIAAPFLLKPFGIFLISMWAVLTIAAIGLNLTLGYAGQVSLAQGAFVGIGAYTVALLLQAGYPFALAFVAAGLLCFAAWRLAQALFDADRRGTNPASLIKRITAAGSALFYIGFAWVAVGMAFGTARQSNSDQNHREDRCNSAPVHVTTPLTRD